MRKVGMAFLLLVGLAALAGTCYASNAQSGPFAISVDSPSIGSKSPQTMTGDNGNQYTAYGFSIGHGTILIAEYPDDLIGFDPVVSVKTAYLYDPAVNQDDIQTQSQIIDGQSGGIAYAYSPKEGSVVYVGMYLFDSHTKVIIVSVGDPELFDAAIKSIHVEKKGSSSASTSQQASQSMLFNSRGEKTVAESPQSGQSASQSSLFGKKTTETPAKRTSSFGPFLAFIGDESIKFVYKGSQKMMGINYDAYLATTEYGNIALATADSNISDVNLIEELKGSFPPDQSIDKGSIETVPYEIDGTDGFIAKAVSPNRIYYAAAYMPDSTTVCIINAPDEKSLVFIADGIRIQKIGFGNGNDEFDPEFDPGTSQTLTPSQSNLFQSGDQEEQSSTTSISDASAQGYYGGYDPSRVNDAISDSYKLINKNEEEKTAQDETNQRVVESMIGPWEIPGAGTVEITSDDLNTMAAAEDNSGRTQYAKLSSYYGLDYSAWKGKVDPLDVFVYALIKLHHDNGKLVPLPVVESGLNGVLLKLVYYNNNTIETTERFWMYYSQLNFDPSYFADPDGVRRDFAMYLDFRDNEDLKRVVPMTQAMLDYESFNNNIMQDWGDHLRMKGDWESLSQTKRRAYLTQWAAEWSVAKAEYELGKSY